MRIEGVVRDVAWGAGGVVVAVIAYLGGAASGKAGAIDAAAVASLKSERAILDASYQKTQQSLTVNKGRLARLDGYEGQTSKLKAEIASQQSSLSSLDESLATKRGELESLTGKVEKIRRQPVDLPAGHFVGGRDIRPGRYTVVGDSNLIVDGRDGESKANVVLGGGQFGVERYVLDIAEGDEIDARGADRYYPMD